MIVTVSKYEISKLCVFTCLGLLQQSHSGLDLFFYRFVAEVLNNSENDPAGLREQTAVVSKIGSQELREDKLLVKKCWQGQQ